MPRLISPDDPPRRLDQSYIDYWGEEGLFRWSKLAMSLVALPDDAKAFLVEVGLPRELKNGSWFLGSWNAVLFRPEGESSRIALRTTNDRARVLVEEGSGRVIWAGRKATRNFPADYPELDLNRSVEQFALCLTECEKLYRRLPPYDHPDEERGTTAFRREISTIDPATLANIESYWSSAIFNMRILK